MSMEVTLTLPDNVYRQVKEMALAMNRPVVDVLAETIRQAFPSLHVDENRATMQQEVAAFEASHANLWQTYANRYVAIRQGAVIGHDADELALVERIDTQYPTEIVLIRQVLPQPPGTLRFRSPRFVSQ